MAVTAGSYVDDAAVRRWLPVYTSAFSSSTTPTDAQVSGYIEEEEARVDAALARVGFTVPLTFTAGSPAERLVRRVASQFVAVRVLRALGAARGGEDLTARAEALEREAADDLARILDQPDLLTAAGLTSTFGERWSPTSWQVDNPTAARSTTPAHAIDDPW